MKNIGNFFSNRTLMVLVTKDELTCQASVSFEMRSLQIKRHGVFGTDFPGVYYQTNFDPTEFSVLILRSIFPQYFFSFDRSLKLKKKEILQDIGMLISIHYTNIYVCA